VSRLLIVNPFATGVTDARIAAVRRELEPVTLAATRGPGHATELAAAAAADSVDAIVVCDDHVGHREVAVDDDAQSAVDGVGAGRRVARDRGRSGDFSGH